MIQNKLIGLLFSNMIDMEYVYYLHRFRYKGRACPKIGVPLSFSKISLSFPSSHQRQHAPNYSDTQRTDDRERELTAAPIIANEGSPNANLP